MGRLNFFQNKPKAKKIDVASYLERLRMKREEPSLNYLKRLQKAHLMHIPFENLDIHYGKKIILDYEKVYAKIIEGGRGGFCYELNGLFYHLLYHLNFECHIISAEVFNQEKEEFGKPFDHMGLIVALDENLWLADVGFGDGIINPIQILENKVQMDYTRYWRIEKDADDRFLLRSSPDTSYYHTEYRFTLQERQLIEFFNMCDYHQSSVESPFTRQKLITQLTDTGRITLTDRELKKSELGEADTSPIMHEDDFLSKLYHHFGISAADISPLK